VNAVIKICFNKKCESTSADEKLSVFGRSTRLCEFGKSLHDYNSTGFHIFYIKYTIEAVVHVMAVMCLDSFEIE
jgi:hypothetical protein